MRGPGLCCVCIAACLLVAVPERALGMPSRGRKLQQTLTGPAPDLAAYRRAGCDNFTSNIWQPLRPAYHITVPYGWMNDPHGMFQIKNTTHVFMQYNPKKIQWGPPFWAHVVSQDLAHWQWLPPALLPDTQYDFNGVWSGASTVPEETGIPILTYTAASSNVPEMGNFFQRQAMAVPANINDPLLKQWVKPTINPFLVQVPPGGTNFQFRDPTEARHAVWIALTSPDNPQPFNRSHFALAIGSQDYCLGGAGIYTAPTMAGPWSYAGNLFNQLDAEPEVNGQCRASRTSSNTSWPGPAYGGPCDQFGAFCRMWEVVDFAELQPGLFLLKWDDQSSFRGIFSLEWYVLGNGPFNYAAINPPSDNNANLAGSTSGSASAVGQQYSSYPNVSTTNGTAPLLQEQRQGGQRDFTYNYVNASDDSGERSLFRGQLDGQRFAPMLMDYGSIYASMLFRTNDMRQIMFSWIYDTAAGCQGSCSDQLPDVIARMGFKSAQTLPRLATFEPMTKTLRLYPVPETELLRGAQVFSTSNASVSTLPQLTTLVPEGTVNSSTTAGRPGAGTGAGANAANASRAAGSNASAAAQPTARQFEVQLNFTLLPPGSSSSNASSNATSAATSGSSQQQPGEFSTGLRILTGNNTYVDVYLSGMLGGSQSGGANAGSAAGSSAGSASIANLFVWVDRSHAGPATNTTFMEGGPVPLPVNGTLLVPQDKLGLSVWVDHSVIEVYALGGLARVTSRIYPEDDTATWGLAVWAMPPSAAGGGGATGGARGNGAGAWSVKFDGSVWEMENAWLPPSC